MGRPLGLKRQAEEEARQNYEARILMVDQYGEWSKGDVFSVPTEGGSFTITGFRLNEQGKCMYVAAVGGSHGSHQCRYFYIEKLQRKKRARAKRKDAE